MSKNRVVVTISGGCVQHIMTNTKDTEVLIIDHDVDGLEEDMMTAIPDEDGEEEMAHVYIYEGVTQGEHEPERVEELFNAVNR